MEQGQPCGSCGKYTRQKGRKIPPPNKLVSENLLCSQYFQYWSKSCTSGMKMAADKVMQLDSLLAFPQYFDFWQSLFIFLQWWNAYFFFWIPPVPEPVPVHPQSLSVTALTALQTDFSLWVLLFIFKTKPTKTQKKPQPSNGFLTMKPWVFLGIFKKEKEDPFC